MFLFCNFYKCVWKSSPESFFLIIVFLLERRCFRTFYFFFSCSVIFSLRENVSRCETTLREVESSPEITKRRFCYKKKLGKNKQQVWRTSSKVNLLIIALWSRRRRRVKVVVVKERAERSQDGWPFRLNSEKTSDWGSPPPNIYSWLSGE